jgi:hypothetical protein
MQTTFHLTRIAQDGFSTRGQITDHLGTVLALTLERAAAGDHPRIPAGTYPIRFKKIGESHFDAAYQKIVGVPYIGMPQICDVPGRAEILIHCGNTYQDSEGCVEVGAEIVPSAQGFKIVGGTSQPKYRNLYPIMEQAVRAGDVALIVTDPVATSAIA